MQFRANLLAALVLCGVSHAAEAAESPAEFLQAWSAMWQAADVEKMMSFYDDSKHTIAIESLGHLRQGPKEIADMYRGAFAELKFRQVTLTPIAHGQQGSVAWATCRYQADVTLKADGRKFVVESRGSFVMKRLGDAWKITSEHFSTIPGVARVRPAED